MPEPGRTKVAILGGGPAGVATGFLLSATPELRARFEITIYQRGWRLGGKGASGRNLDRGKRIEEHGLHVWFGFYAHAFRLIRDCYAELGERAWTDEFLACGQVVLFDGRADKLAPYAVNLGRHPGTPGDSVPTTPRELIPGALQVLTETARVPAGAAAPDTRALLGTLMQLASAVKREGRQSLLDRLCAEARQLVEAVTRLCGGQPPPHKPRTVTEVLHEAHQQAATIRRASSVTPAPDVPEAQLQGAPLWMWLMMVDLALAVVRGIVAAKLLDGTLDTLDDHELRTWLRANGASEATVTDAPFLIGLYDLAFGYEDGDKSRPNLAAGKAVLAMLNLANYKGAFMYKMAAGMGDVVFAPLYEVLRRRDVRVAFFHCVTALRCPPQSRTVETIELLEQAQTLSGSDYAPLTVTDPTGRRCWPNEPDYSQLAEPQRVQQFDLEAEDGPPDSPRRILTRGVDFDEVVLAIPVGAQAQLAADLAAANSGYQAMLDESHTVATQAAQVWLTRSPSALGWPYEPMSAATTFPSSLDTYSDMSHLLAAEDWTPQDNVNGIAYFCSVLDDRRTVPPRLPMQEALGLFLGRSGPQLWPKAAVPGATGIEFDWNVLAASRLAGTARVDDQYHRANISPSARYVTTPAGSTKYRLHPARSGFSNLTLAGDWTHNHIDGGCVEAAVISANWAAQALIDRSLAAKPSRRYVEFGSLATVPGPLVCRGADVYWLLAPADLTRIAALCRRTFTDVSGGEAKYTPFLNSVLVSFLVIDRITSEVPPFDMMGGVTEPEVAIWIPVIAWRDGLPHHLAVFVPYIWLDNSMSIATGREMYGYPKAFGTHTVTGEKTAPDTLELKVYGMDYSPTATPEMNLLISVKATTPLEAVPAGPGPRAFAEQLISQATARLATQSAPAAAAAFRAAAAADFTAPTIRQLFLRQFRAAEDGTLAALQQIMEVPAKVHPGATGSLLPRRYQLTAHPLDSHPLAADLGLVGTLDVELAWRVLMDFTVEPGTVIWPTRTLA